MLSLSAHLRAAAVSAALIAFGCPALAQTATPARAPKGVKSSTPATSANHVTKVAKTVVRRQPAPVIAGAAQGESVKTLVSLYAQRHGVPDALAHRIVLKESRYNPAIRSRAHFGLMQISLPTARQMGYTGDPNGLLDARTNLAHGMPYLANAWIVSGGNEAGAASLYSRGYYNDAKRKGLTRSLRTARSAPVEAVDIETLAIAQ